MKCRKCGNELDENAKYCPFCGEMIQTESDSNTNETENEKYRMSDNSNNNDVKEADEEKNKEHEGISAKDSRERENKSCRGNVNNSNIIGRVCTKCGALTFNEKLNHCTKCGGSFTSTGYTLKQWQDLSANEKLDLMRKLTPTIFDDKNEKENVDSNNIEEQVGRLNKLDFQNQDSGLKIKYLEERINKLEQRTKVLSIIIIVAVVVGVLSCIVLGINVHQAKTEASNSQEQIEAYSDALEEYSDDNNDEDDSYYYDDEEDDY